MRAKQRNDEKFNNRVREKELKMQIEEENRQKYLNDRVQRQVIKEKTIKAIKKSKKDDFKIGKTMTLQNTQFKKEFNNEVQKSNHMRKEKVKDEAAMRADRLRQLEEMKKADNQDHYNSRVDNEKQRILDHEKKIKKMEKLEAELLR